MKHFLIFSLSLSSLIFFSCSAAYEMKKSTVVYKYDFTEYTQKGFLFTPESYSGDYDAIGIIEVNLYPSVNKKSNQADNYSEEEGETWIRGSEEWFIGRIDAQEGIDSLYIVCKKIGADALTELTVEDAKPISNGLFLVDGIKVSGFAIKRK